MLGGLFPPIQTPQSKLSEEKMPLRFLHPFVDATKNIKYPSNPYVEKFLNNGLPILHGEKLQTCVGKWRDEIERFHASANVNQEDTSKRPLWIEIGCHMGQILATLAESYPSHSIVGIDITFKRIVRSAEKLINKNLKNAMCVFADARFIDELFTKEEVSGVIVFFPDPWTKKKRSKNRLFSLEFGEKLFSILQPGGFVWFKTDQKEYFEQVLQIMQSLGFESVNEVERVDFISEKDKYTSLFERLFTHKGLSTYEALWKKREIRV